jgi:hypothetical protein
MKSSPPDVLVLGPEWPERALLRAELIEEGYDVVAIDAWPIPQLYRRPRMTPRVAVVDLQGLPDPRMVLDELQSVMPRNRVLVITALGTVRLDEIRHMGYEVVTRPTSVSDIVAAVAGLLQASDAHVSESARGQ